MYEFYTFLTGAVAGGGLLTVWKWLAGWNKTNLTFIVELKRTRSPDDEFDNLICYAKLKKGDRGSVALETIQVLVTADGVKVIDEKLSEVNLTERKENLNITAGEEAQFALYASVPRKAICKAVGTVTGRALQRKGSLAVWKGSDYSVPAPPSIPAVEKVP